MNETIQAFLKDCRRAGMPEKTALSPEFVAAAEQVSAAVESWGTDHRVMSPAKGIRGTKIFAANEDISIESIEQTIGAESVAELCVKAGVADCHRAAAAEKVGAILAQTLGREGKVVFAEYGMKSAAAEQGKADSLESFYGPELWSAISPATEAFGIQMDRVTPDLKTILTVALLQFHMALTPRIVPIQAVTQSNVQITRESMIVFDMSKPEAKPVRAIHLYNDPSMVSVKATRIEPLKANDADGKYLVDNGVYKFRTEFNLFKLALDPTRPGYDKFNHTDIVEDGICVDGVLVKIAKAGTPAQGTEGEDGYVPATDAVEEQFMIPLPQAKARLTQIADDYLSTERRLSLDHTTLTLNAESPLYGSTEASALLADLTAASGKFLAFRIKLYAHVDRKTAMADADCWFTQVRIDSDVDGYEMSEAEKAIVDSITVEPVGFTLDARYNEDNKRKTSIRAEINKRNMSYELPSGRNFVVDSAIGQEGAVNASARLAQLEHIGRDGCNLKIITTTMDQVHDARLMRGNGEEAAAEIAATYAAGDMVNQIVVRDSIDFENGFIANASNEAEADVKQFMKTRLNKIVTALNATSMIQHQLAQGYQMTYRMITSPYILGAILQLHHIREHLDRMDQKGTGSVEYVMNLSCGTKLEIVTSTFDMVQNKIIILPFFESAPTSVLNFGTDWDQGTLVGSVSLGADGTSVHNRLFSTTREALIPTNVVGAVIDVIGLGNVLVDLGFKGITVNDTSKG